MNEFINTGNERILMFFPPQSKSAVSVSYPETCNRDKGHQEQNNKDFLPYYKTTYFTLK